MSSAERFAADARAVGWTAKVTTEKDGAVAVVTAPEGGRRHDHVLLAEWRLAALGATHLDLRPTAWRDGAQDPQRQRRAKAPGVMNGSVLIGQAVLDLVVLAGVTLALWKLATTDTGKRGKR